MLSKRFLMVPELSSAARMPLPSATMARPMSSSFSVMGLLSSYQSFRELGCPSLGSRGRQFAQDLLRNVKVGKNVLDVVVFFEGCDELHDRFGVLLVHIRRQRRFPNGFDAFGFAEFFLERGCDRAKLIERADDEVAG